MDTIRLYLHSVRMLMKCRMQYPVSFALQTLAQLVMESGEMLAVLLVIDRFGCIGQWSGGDLMVFFGVMEITFYLTEIFGRGLTGSFASLIRQGTLDTILLRPRGVLTQVLCQEIDPRRIGCIAVGIVSLSLGTKGLSLVWTLPRLLALAEAILCGMLLVLGLFLIEAVFSIYSVKSLEMVNALTYGGRSACRYPADVFPRPMRVIFSVIAPFSMTLHMPVSFILGKQVFPWPAWTAFLCPLAGPAAFFLMRLVFGRALKHYRSTGS